MHPLINKIELYQGGIMLICTRMRLLSNDYAEYKQRHQQVYPELEQKFKAAGVSEYTIWFDDELCALFAYVKLDNITEWNMIPESEICQKWWQFMADIMEANPDNSPVSKELIKVYEYKENNE